MLNTVAALPQSWLPGQTTSIRDTRQFPGIIMDFIPTSQDCFLSDQERDAYWTQRIAGLEQIICDLLRENWELRFELAKPLSHSTPDGVEGD